MTATGATIDQADTRFREVAFTRLPLGCLAAAAVAGAVGGTGWSVALGPVPWLVSLGLVGLPHGAADLAASRRVWNGWPLAGVWLAYVAAMAVVATGFFVAPLAAIAAFAAVSCWHFGAAHLNGDDRPDGGTCRTVAALSRGTAVLAVPLATWPAATAAAAADLAALAVGHTTAATLFAPAAIRAIGITLLAATMAAVVVEGLVAARTPGGLTVWSRLLAELAVFACLGQFTDPLFSVGLYFLAWHAWRQMEPLTKSLTGSSSSTWHDLGASLVRIHAAALPLLVPTWAAIGTVWWYQSTGHTLREVAIVSIAAYLIVTPAHELLGDLLRTRVRYS